ncbi:MAG: hypothetical protein QF773_09610 [Lentisphaeria bacterium]|jgi:hypothetical protein|nr:hypothetical protein [Lentisphaeria bacterium]
MFGCTDAQFELTRKRFAAWWESDILDRPPVTLGVKPVQVYSGPSSEHAGDRDRWLDIEYNLAAGIAELERQVFAGDSFPTFHPNIGPELIAAMYGCELEFRPDTSWSIPVITDPVQWDEVAAADSNFEGIYWRTIVELTDAALAVSDGRFLVGVTDLHGNYDNLAAMRDPQQLCTDLVDCPERVAAAGRRITRGFVDAFNALWRRIEPAGLGCTTWSAMHHDGPTYLPSCDFWCMVSDAMASQFILPDIVAEMAPLERSLFHLDGPQALRHLDLLLALPELDGVQWVYGAGAGPAARWTDVYRRILDAGKCAQVIADGPEDALAVLDTCGPKGLWLHVGGDFDDVDSADAFLAEVARRSACSDA